MKREVYILAAALLFLTGCSSQKKESPSVQPEASVTAAMKTETPTFAVMGTELESESRSKAVADIKPASDAPANSAPDSEGEIPEWWGIYQDGDKQLGITNFNGTMFLFDLKAGEDHVLDGAAAVEPGNHYMADYMDLHFEYRKGKKDTVITLWEEREDSGERTIFAGTYSSYSDQE